MVLSEAGILVVGDHEGTLYALESALAPLGRRIARVTSGDEALKQVLRGRVGLLLLDVSAPGAGGLDIVRCMHGLEQTQHIPVVLLTGFGLDHELTAAAYGLGVADLVTKPVDPWSLRTKVRYLYDAHQRQLALQGQLRELRARAGAPVAPAHREARLAQKDARVPSQRDTSQRDTTRGGRSGPPAGSGVTGLPQEQT